MCLILEFILTAAAAVRLSRAKQSWWKALFPIGIGFGLAFVYGALRGAAFYGGAFSYGAEQQLLADIATVALIIDVAVVIVLIGIIYNAKAPLSE